MSTNYHKGTPNGNNKRKNTAKLALIAGIIAFGIFATAFNLSSNRGNSANAQSTNNNNTTTIGTEWQQQKLTPPTVSTSGTATTKVTPDKFSVTIGVETNGTTAREAASNNANLMSKVVSALKDLGVKENEIGTSNYNIYPVYQSMQPKACPQIYPIPPECQPGVVIIGYRASNSADVTLNVNGTIDAGKVIDTAVKAGANNISGVNFFISQEMQQKIKDSLTRDAVINAKHRAEIAADAVNMTVSGVQSINLSEVYFPTFYKSLDMAAQSAGSNAAPTPILPSQQEVTTTVSIVFYLNNNNMSSEGGHLPSTTSMQGMLSTRNNTNCVNPANGPMIC